MYYTWDYKLNDTSAGSSSRFARPPCYYQLYKIKNYDVAVLSNDTTVKQSFVEFCLLLWNRGKGELS